jgi:hypothetical protein
MIIVSYLSPLDWKYHQRQRQKCEKPNLFVCGLIWHPQLPVKYLGRNHVVEIDDWNQLCPKCFTLKEKMILAAAKAGYDICTAETHNDCCWDCRFCGRTKIKTADKCPCGIQDYLIVNDKNEEGL